MENISLRKIRSHIMPIALLVGITLVVYAASMGHKFLLNWDDSIYVVNNESIRGLSWVHLKEAFTQFYGGNYAPIQIISYIVDYTLWGLRPAGFIFSNVLIHIINGVLFYVLLVYLTRRKALGFLAAFIFLLHPVQVESVVWISQRKNLLAMLFFLVSFLFYIAYQNSSERKSILSYISSIITFAFALLSKSVAVILPLVLLLYDLSYLEKAKRKKWIANKIPYLLLAGAATIITLKSQAPEHGGGRISYDIEGPLSLFYTMLTVLVSYFRLLVWPTNLSAIYIPLMKFRIDDVVGWSAVLCALLIALGIYLCLQKRDLFFWFSLFFVGLLPVSQIVSLVTLMNDRYLYFPMLGAAAFYGLIIFQPASAIFNFRKKIVVVILCLLVVPLPFLSWERTSVWKNDLSLWSDTAQKAPSPLAWVSLGMSYRDAGQPDEAIEAFKRALSLDPDDMLALNNIGSLYIEQGEVSKARPFLLRVVELFPDYFNGLMNLGSYYYLSNELQNAEITLSKAVALQPQSPQLLSRLGDVYLRMKKIENAKKYYLEAITIGGRNAYLEYKLARVEALGGRTRDALERLESACRMGFNDYANISKDPAFDAIRGRVEFQILIHQYCGK